MLIATFPSEAKSMSPAPNMSTFAVPTFAYHVSGEYAMWKAASEAGYIDGKRTLLETMMAFKRAGADGILTYAALEVAELLRG